MVLLPPRCIAPAFCDNLFREGTLTKLKDLCPGEDYCARPPNQSARITTKRDLTRVSMTYTGTALNVFAGSVMGSSCNLLALTSAQSHSFPANGVCLRCAFLSNLGRVFDLLEGSLHLQTHALRFIIFHCSLFLGPLLSYDTNSRTGLTYPMT